MNLKRLFVVLVVALIGALLLAGPALAGHALTTQLTGAAVVPGPGDPDGSGTATITVNPGKGEVCWDLSVKNITLPATGAHIHVGAASSFPGAAVVTLTPPDASGESSGCRIVSRELAKAIHKNPENYFVDVHTLPLYGAGALMGQLS
jgi:hypothetical protein